MKKKRFYFKGVFFDSEEDFFKYVEYYQNSPITETSVKEMLSHMEKEIWLNILNPKEMSIRNGQMQEILSNATIEIIEGLRKIENKTSDT